MIFLIRPLYYGSLDGEKDGTFLSRNIEIL